MDEYREKESEELKGSERRKEVEMRKRAKGGIWDTRVKVGYSMPLWLKEKINKESLEQGLYQWEYIAKMIKRAENCPEDSNYEQLREENERLKKENEQLRMSNERLERENRNLEEENKYLRVRFEDMRLRFEKWIALQERLDDIIALLERCDKALEAKIREETEGIRAPWRVDKIEKNREIIRETIEFLRYLKEK
jgi:uncharacterized protein YllA (UPF0747 family)